MSKSRICLTVDNDLKTKIIAHAEANGRSLTGELLLAWKEWMKMLAEEAKKCNK